MTHRVSVFTEGILAMQKTLLGVQARRRKIVALRQFFIQHFPPKKMRIMKINKNIEILPEN